MTTVSIDSLFLGVSCLCPCWVVKAEGFFIECNQVKKKIGVQLPLSPEPPDLRSQSSNVHESRSSLRSLPPYWLRYNSGSPLLSIIAIDGGTGGGAESYGHTERGSGASTHECPIANGLLWGHSVWGGSQECRWGTRE